jgi:hypothetical protein
MKPFALWAGVVLCLLWAAPGRAQNTGRIECARSDEYVYLYSSMTTLQVRATLQCDEIVYITLRYEYYYGVRTAKGENGFVDQSSIVVLKDEPGGKLPTQLSDLPRERTHYDKSPGVAKAPARVVPSFTLAKDTPVHLKVVKTISSATARVGDPVELEVTDDVLVEGVPVLTKGAKVTGAIADAEPKKRFGHNGKLAFSISSLTLADGEQAPLRSYEEAPGSWSSSSVAISSKDVAIPQNTEYTVLIDGDVHLKREAFEVPKDKSASAPAPPSAATPQR